MSPRLSALLLAALSVVLVDRPSSPMDARAPAPPPPPAAPTATMAKLPVRFEANVGQMHEDVRFVARKGPSTLFLGDRGATLAIHKKKPAKRDLRDRVTPSRARREPGERAVVNLTVAGGRSVTPQPSEQMVTKTNYFIGNDRSKWRTGVPSYAKVTYPSVLDGVDLVYHGENGSLEYDFVVAPGTSVDTIAMNVDGAADMELNASGDLVIHTRAGDILQPKPVVYQRGDDGAKRTIASSYRIVDKNKVGFVVASYDRDRELVIDPVIGFATFLGGGADDYATAVAADAAGNTYVTGATRGSFPVVNALYPDFNENDTSDVFVAKINQTGTAIEWATYFGSYVDDWAAAIALNPQNNDVFIAGSTAGSEGNDFPIAPQNAFNSVRGYGDDGFVARFSNDGQTLHYSTLLNGEEDEFATSIAVDASGVATVGGVTNSWDFTEFGTYPRAEAVVPDGKFSLKSGFVVRLNAFGTDDLFTHVIPGGNGRVEVYGVAIDGSGGAYAAGYTTSPLQHVPPNAAQDCSGASGSIGDAFITRIRLQNQEVTTDYLTCLGGSGQDDAAAIAVDADGNAYVTGRTFSSDFPTTSGAYQETVPGEVNLPNAFVTKVNASGTAFVYSTNLGGSRFDAAYGIGVDASRTAWVVGETTSSDFPAPTPLPGTQFNGGAEPVSDAFITRLDASGSNVVFSTFYGGPDYDSALGIAVRQNSVHVVGSTYSEQLPVLPNALQNENAGSVDGFVVTVTVPPLLISPPSVQLQVNGSQQFAATGGTGFGYVFSVSQNNSGATINPSTGVYVAGATGNVTDIVTVTDAAGSTANATVIVGASASDLVLTPTNASVTPRGQRQFTASGGVPPYTFNFASNASQGTISTTGLYTAGTNGSVVDVVRVTDTAGNSRTAVVTVGPAITINPATPSAPPNGTIAFTATGGSGTGYAWTITQNGSNGATIGASTGQYKAGGTANTVDTVQVTDSLGNKASVQVSVGGGLAISPDNPSTAPRGTIEFSAFGGSGSYTWSMIASPSGGDIDPGTGVYTAGATGNVIDVVKVTDSLGNGRAVEITVGPALAILPTTATVLTGVQIGFSGSGGSGAGYTWSIPDNQSGATIDANGLYTSGERAGTDTVRLTDSFGSTAEAVVVVEARPTPPPEGPPPGGVGSIDGGTFDGLNIGGGGDDDCSCRAVGTSSSPAGGRLIASLALALGLVLRRRRR